jgi:hypothetical protein
MTMPLRNTYTLDESTAACKLSAILESMGSGWGGLVSKPPASRLQGGVPTPVIFGHTTRAHGIKPRPISTSQILWLAPHDAEQHSLIVKKPSASEMRARGEVPQ